MEDMLGYCGIDCAKCDIHKAALDPAFAAALAEKWHKWEPKAEADWFRCRGCKGPDEGHWSADCKIRLCAAGRSVAHCGQCADFKCDLIRAFESDKYKHHKQAVKHLEELRQASRSDV